MDISFNKDYANKKIVVTCTFNSPVNIVWDSFTNPVTLEKWFAPKPYKAITKRADFREDGFWLYYMLSPKDEKFWSITKYKKIVVNNLLEAEDAFCDENGVINNDLPQLNWHYEFLEKNNTTGVRVVITVTDEQQMKQLLKMGFEEGYKMGLNQLEELLGR